MTIEVLIFKDHPYMPDMYQAKANGCSVIYGRYVERYEVMDQNGDCHRNLSLEEARKVVFS